MNRSLSDLRPELAALAQQLLDEAETLGIPIFVTETLRTYSRQDQLFHQGRTTDGEVVTNARAGESNHNYGLAFDVAFRAPPAADPFDGPWAAIGEIGRNLGLRWGGDFSSLVDRPHFELPSPASTRVRKAAGTARLRRGVGAARRHVEEIQTLLNAAGFEAGAVDGDFGAITEAAVQRLQRAGGLVPTGVLHLRELELLEQTVQEA